MSWQSCPDPAHGDRHMADAIETVIVRFGVAQRVDSDPTRRRIQLTVRFSLLLALLLYLEMFQ
jgi:hypothetical protein